MTILPLAYLPSIEQFAHLQRGGCIIDLGEHFVKRSERNRARILTTDSVMELTAHVSRANSPRQPMREMRLDYSKRWQHQHWGALVASYKSSPYFDFYADDIKPFYRREETFLVDLNLQLLELLCRLTQVAMPQISEHYLTATANDLDLRPKQPLYTPTPLIVTPQLTSQKEGPTFHAEPYVQVFADRMPFEANLSVVDLLFAEGPASVSVLKRCLRG